MRAQSLGSGRGTGEEEGQRDVGEEEGQRESPTADANRARDRRGVCLVTSKHHPTPPT